ncbi:MAG: hypothetical protein IPI04_19350 [Ignavibacteria bacterium]|nr:hypothetical protein [Ignavibacteria bacterium]
MEKLEGNKTELQTNDSQKLILEIIHKQLNKMKREESKIKNEIPARKNAGIKDPVLLRKVRKIETPGLMKAICRLSPGNANRQIKHSNTATL